MTGEETAPGPDADDGDETRRAETNQEPAGRTGADEETEARIRDRLAEVLDPCSCFTDDPVNIVDLGLVEDVRVSDDVARVELLLTSPGCTYLPYIERDVAERVGDVEGIETVDVVQVTDRIWTRERMADEVREGRRERFRTRMEAAGITPYAERSD